jgi:ABC-type nitrate/sulfonate/bicarbonate transport system permease component
MPQKDLLMPWRTVLDNTTLGPEVAGMARSQARALAHDALARFGLAGFEHAWPDRLSGGMRQRAALLRTFLSGKRLMLLDEPFGALDALTRQEMQRHLLDLWTADRTTVIFVTHDVEEAVFLSDRVYVMSPRPGCILRTISIDLPRPRDPSITLTPHFLDLRRRTLEPLYVPTQFAHPGHRIPLPTEVLPPQQEPPAQQEPPHQRETPAFRPGRAHTEGGEPCALLAADFSPPGAPDGSSTRDSSLPAAAISTIAPVAATQPPATPTRDQEPAGAPLNRPRSDGRDAPTAGGGSRRRGPHDSGRRSWGHLVRILPPLVFAALVLGAWQLAATITGISDLLLPRPSQIGHALWQDRAILASNAWVTVQEILIGYALAILVGCALGVLLHGSRLIERAVYPWLVVSQAIPTIAIAPIFVLWTGFDVRPKVMVIVLVSFFPLVVNTIAGLRAIDYDLVNLLRTMDASRPRIFRVARVPAALPSVFTGMKVAAALAVVGAVFGEWVGASSGLGYLILTYNNQTATADVFAAIAVLAAIGIALFALVTLAERALLPWYHATRVDR